MFFNGMMAPDNNDNFEFAVHAARWLLEGTDGKTHSKALFIVDGRIVTTFAPPPQPIPMPPLSILNRLLRGWEEERWM